MSAETSRLIVNGAELLAGRSGALLWPEARALVVADLHLEKASALNRRGAILPPFDTRTTLAHLGEAIQRHDPALVICLGDSFHDRRAAAAPGEEIHCALQALSRGRRWIWITGNHDPEPPASLPGEGHGSLEIAPLVFRHRPEENGAAVSGEVAGHYHPKAAVRVRGRRLTGRCFVEDGCRLILPAFGAYAGGLNVLDPAIRDLFQKDFSAHVIGRRSVHSYPGRALVA